MITAFVYVSADQHQLPDLAIRVADLDGVSEVYSVTGDEDLVAIIRVPEHEDLAEIVTTKIAALEGVRHTRTSIAFRAYSNRDMEVFGPS